jgi:hypothetical protein
MVAHEVDRLAGADRVGRDAHEQVLPHLLIVTSRPTFEVARSSRRQDVGNGVTRRPP